MERKVFGYYEIGEELLIPITQRKAVVVRVEKTGKKGCLDCYLRHKDSEACVMFPCMPAQREDGRMAILRKIGEVEL